MGDPRLERDPGSGILHRDLGPAAPEALLLLLHGVGGHEGQMEAFALQQDPGFRICLLRGPHTFGEGRFGWFEVMFLPKGTRINPVQAEESRRQLAAFIEGLQCRTGLGPARTLVAGFSQGGIMSAGLALTRPDLVAGFGLLSGRILPELAPLVAPREALAGLRGFVSHGRQDATLPVAQADRSDAWLQELGVAAESHRYEAGHDLTPAMAAAFRAWAGSTLDLG